MLQHWVKSYYHATRDNFIKMCSLTYHLLWWHDKVDLLFYKDRRESEQVYIYLSIEHF